MFILLSTTSPFIKSVLTLAIIIFLVLIYFFEQRLLKREEKLKSWLIILTFIVSFLLLLVSILGILYIWDYDFSVYFATFGSDTLQFIENSVGNILTSLIVIFISLMIMKISKTTLKKVGLKPGPLQKRKRTISKVTTSIIKYIVGLLMVLIVLSIWGINVAPALAGLGILGLVVGLGAQKFINDLISGFFIIFEQHFDVGDVIEVQGFRGEVTDIGLKTTRLRNWKGEVRIFSNGEVSSLLNYSKSPTSTAVVEFGIAYHENIQKTVDILNTELPKMRLEFPVIIEDPKVAGVIALNSSSVDLRVVAKTLNEQHFAIERELRKRIKQILNDNNIEIPFPQVVVHKAE